MTGYRIVAEGMVETERLSLFHLRTAPEIETERKILYLGGSGHDLRLKRGFLDSEITRCAHVATYEPRGIGRSDQPDGSWSMAEYAMDAVAFLDALGWAKAHVIGESFGGMTSLHLAAMAPDRMTALALVSATAGGAGGRSYDIGEFLDMPRDEAVVRSMILQDREIDTLRHTDPDAFQKVKASRIEAQRVFHDPSVSSGGYGRLRDARRGHDAWDVLGSIACPVVVMAGRRDDQAPIRAQKRMADALPHARYLEFDGGHGFGFANPDAMKTLCELWFPT